MVLTWYDDETLYLNLGKLLLRFERPLPRRFNLRGRNDLDRYLLSYFDKGRIGALRGDIGPE